MKNRLLWIVICVFSATSVAAQSPSAGPLPVVSPQISADRRVTFRLLAPKADEVHIVGDFWLKEGRSENLIKDGSGVWSFTTEPVVPGYYSYVFKVDGVSVPDPSNVRIKSGTNGTQSAFFVPGQKAAYLEEGPAPHGEVRIVFYQSKVTGILRRMHIYLPPGYDAGQTRYPVVYLLHGGGDSDNSWIETGRVNFILDNLIAQGKARPMIVAMPNLWTLGLPLASDRFEENLNLFRKDLIEEVLPYVENHYRVLTGPAHRALGGLGARREFLPNIYWPVIGKFGYIFHASGGVNAEWVPLLEEKYPGVLDDAGNVGRVKFFIGNGTNDHSLPAATFWTGELKRRGYDVTYFESQGNHGWPWFRRYFFEFAKTAFK